MKRKSVWALVVFIILVALVIMPGLADARTSRVEFTGTETVDALLADGDWTFPDGNVHVRGRVTRYLEVTTDPRKSGLNTVVMNANWGPDFAGPMWGTSESVVWDSPGCPGGGIWRSTWAGMLNPDGSYTYSAVGRGVSGCVAGLHSSRTAYSPGTGATTVSGEILDPWGE